MAVAVTQVSKEKEDPLEKLMKVVSIGTSVAGMSKSGSTSSSDSDGQMAGAMSRRLGQLKKSYV